MKLRVLVSPTGWFAGCKYTLKPLEAIAEVEFNDAGRPFAEAELVKRIQDVDGFISAQDVVSADVLKHADKLKVISLFGVGFDNVDIEEATRRGIVIANTPGLLGDAVADMTFGLLISTVRKIPQANNMVKSGEWSGDFLTKREAFLSPHLTGKTLGIIGLGSNGLEVARRAKGFKMRVLYYDSVRKLDAENDIGVTYAPYKELLEESDIVTLHAPLTEQTRHMVGETEISWMKKGAYLINTSRGGLVDEVALIDALKTGKLSGAGLDVLDFEPPPADNPILKLDNVVITPHIAAYTIHVVESVAEKAVANVKDVLLGKTPEHIVNPGVLTRKRIVRTS